jgi:hypothetical protein
MSTTATIEFPFESPCAGQLEGLLALAVDQGPGDEEKGARARAHLGSCRKCQRAMNWIDMQRSTARQVSWQPSHEPFGSHRWSSGFENWLDCVLAQHANLALDRAAWRIAYRLVVASPITRENIGQFELDTPEEDQLKCELAQFMKVESRRVRLLADAASRGCSTPRVDLGLARRLVYWVERNASPDWQCAMLRTAIDWLGGASEAATNDYERISVVSRSITTRAEALSSLSVLAIDRGDLGSALNLGTLALVTDPSNTLAHCNRIYLDAMLGRETSVLRAIERLSRMPRGANSLRRHSAGWLLATGNSIARSLDLPRRVARHRIAWLVDRVHGPTTLALEGNGR